MALSQHDVAQRFIEDQSGTASNFYSEVGFYGRVLKSYATIVAVRLDDDTVALNPVKYSVSTSCQLSKLRSALVREGFRETEDTVSPPSSGSYYYRSNEPFVIWRRG